MIHGPHNVKLMHSARPNVDHKTFLVTVNKCSMKVRFFPKRWLLWLFKIRARTLHENLGLLIAS